MILAYCANGPILPFTLRLFILTPVIKYTETLACCTQNCKVVVHVFLLKSHRENKLGHKIQGKREKLFGFVHELYQKYGGVGKHRKLLNITCYSQNAIYVYFYMEKPSKNMFPSKKVC